MAARRKVPNYAAILKAYERDARRLERAGFPELARQVRRCMLQAAQEERRAGELALLTDGD